MTLRYLLKISEELEKFTGYRGYFSTAALPLQYQIKVSR